jgi:hypothetical protein
MFVGKPEGKTPIGKRMHRWKNNIKVELTELACEDMDWNQLAY